MIDNNSNLTGKVIGSCMLETLIEQGGMSVVYRAQQVHPVRRLVAVKILLPEALVDSELHNEFLARFKREAQIIAKLQHPNIIPLYEYGEQDGEAYLVMPFLAGGSLSKVLSRRGVLTLQETLNYSEQAAAALDYAHKYKIIHRDLKPSNFLIDSDGKLILADFGIARIMRENGRTNVSTLTNPGVLLGTPDYMSPEMVQGQPIDYRSDIYQLGIVLFQMLSGEVPIKGSTPSIFTKHVYEPLPLLHPANPGISSAVDDVIQKATAKRCEDRFASAGAMAKALRLAIASPTNYSSKGTVNYAPSVLAAMATPSTFDPYVITSNPPATSKTSEEYTSALSIPNISAKRQRKPQVILPIVLTIVAFMIVIGAIPLGLLISGLLQGQSQSNTQQTTTPPLSQQAKQTVQQYYDYWNEGKYQDAYNLLSSDYRKDHPYSSLQHSYEATRHATIQILSVTPFPDGSFKVTISDSANEVDPSGTLALRTYNLYFIVKLENSSWKLFPHFIYS